MTLPSVCHIKMGYLVKCPCVKRSMECSTINKLSSFFFTLSLLSKASSREAVTAVCKVFQYYLIRQLRRGLSTVKLLLYLRRYCAGHCRCVCWKHEVSLVLCWTFQARNLKNIVQPLSSPRHSSSTPNGVERLYFASHFLSIVFAFKNCTSRFFSFRTLAVELSFLSNRVICLQF